MKCLYKLRVCQLQRDSFLWFSFLLFFFCWTCNDFCHVLLVTYLFWALFTDSSNALQTLDLFYWCFWILRVWSGLWYLPRTPLSGCLCRERRWRHIHSLFIDSVRREPFTTGFRLSVCEASFPLTCSETCPLQHSPLWDSRSSERADSCSLISYANAACCALLFPCSPISCLMVCTATQQVRLFH